MDRDVTQPGSSTSNSSACQRTNVLIPVYHSLPQTPTYSLVPKALVMSPIQTRARARRENIPLPGYLSSNPKPTSTSSNRFKHTTAISAKRFKINRALEHGQRARVALADRPSPPRVSEANTKRAPRHARYYPELRIWPVDDYQYPAAAPLRTAPKVRWAEDIEYNEYPPGDQGDQELVVCYSRTYRLHDI